MESNPSSENPNFKVNDLVWGKIKSHPWWPGQIFDPKHASEFAIKKQKKDHLLVAYFGDKTFAWVQESQLKHFKPHFKEMENQSSSDTFVNAVNDALDELSRRVELGLACKCLNEEIYMKLKNDDVVNSGIKEGTYFEGVVESEIKPEIDLDFIWTRAQCPLDGFDRLEHAMVVGRLKAFYGLKGNNELCVFEPSVNLAETDGLVEVNVDLSVKLEKKPRSMPRKIKEEKEENEEELSWENTGGKRKYVRKSSEKKWSLEDSDSVELKRRKKVKNDVEVSEKSSINSEKHTSGNTRKKDQSHKMEKEEKEDSLNLEKSERKVRKKKKFDDDSDSDTIGRGKKMKRKRENEILLSTHKKSIEIVEKMKQAASKLKTSLTGEEIKEFSPSEMLSQLCLLASDTMNDFDFLPMTKKFFTDFRHSVASDLKEDQEPVKSVGRKRGRKKKEANGGSASFEMSESDCVQDSYWSDIVFQGSPEKEPASKKRGRKKQGAKDVETRSYSVMKTDEETPTILILGFSGSDALPTVPDLNKVFSAYGPLKEEETQILEKNQAKVVFKDRNDAEQAFSDAGNHGVFGTTLVSYRLRYSHQSSPISSL